MAAKTETWDDSAIRPPNADTTIGWAGVPLSQTLGYYGHIKRPLLPTTEVLGFTADYSKVNVSNIAESFVNHLANALESSDADAVAALVSTDGYWKDVELLTWDIRTLHGPDIKPMLVERLPKTKITNVRINDQAPPILETLGPDLSFILVHIEFDFLHGTGVGVLRLSPLGAKTGSIVELADANTWRIYSIGTAVNSVGGWDAEFGDKARYQQCKLKDANGKTVAYDDMRSKEVNDADPTVVIIGAGQTGLAMAARLKVLGISHLIIEKEDKAGYSWSNRYATLSLHGPTFTNHLPGVPFPHWFPTFLPAQQLGKFLEKYADIMDLNIWTKSIFDGASSKYDDAKGHWNLSVTRSDGTTHTLHPKHLMIATGISGTNPNVPQIAGMDEFQKNGGVITHSSTHRTKPEWKGKKVVIVGAATSGHDLANELYDNGCSVSMIQRSATHVMSVDRSVRYLFASRELTNRRGGQSLEIMDQAQFLRHPFPVEYELLRRGQAAAKELDKDLLQSLRDVGYRLHDGYHGGGAYSMFMFDQGGFYWNTGACELIAQKKIALTHSEIDRFTRDGVVYKDGTSEAVDIVVFATGYMNSKSAIQAQLGDEMAMKCHERWEKGNAFFVGPEGESIINYCPLPQKGLYAMFHQFAFSRFHSGRLALRIKAEELGIDVTPYGKKPLGPPSTAAGRQPRPEGVPL